MIKEYLIAEAENDVALRFVQKDNKMILFGRGDLHLGVLLERMRRDGFEMLVSPPEVITDTVDG
jgi:GTP-binding protein